MSNLMVLQLSVILRQSKAETFGLTRKVNSLKRTTGYRARELGVSVSTFYGWRKKNSCMEAYDAKRLKELDAENSKLKAIYAESQLDNKVLKDALSKKW